MSDIERQASILFDRVHQDSAWRKRLRNFCHDFSSGKGHVRNVFIDYMSHSGEHDNQMYSSPEIRYAMLVESEQKDSWHFARRAFLRKCLDHKLDVSTPRIVHDYGFGIVRPEYIDRGLAGSHHFTLSDAFQSAIDVGEFMLRQSGTSKEQCHFTFIRDELDNAPLDQHSPDLVILLDSIEHTPDPTAAIKKIIASSNTETLFCLILPVGPLIASHYISWKSTDCVRSWLTLTGLKILEEEEIFPDGAFDIFAKSTNGTYDYAVLCRRI